MKSKIPTTKKLLKYIIHHPGKTAFQIAHAMYGGDIQIAMDSLKDAEMYLTVKDGSANQFRDINEEKYGPNLYYAKSVGVSYYHELISTDRKFYATFIISILALILSIISLALDYKSLPQNPINETIKATIEMPSATFIIVSSSQIKSSKNLFINSVFPFI